MNIRKLTAFREVMITGSVSAAARNLNKSQPSISALIATLEADLGIVLFERQGGRLKPTSEAHLLLSETNQILARLESARQTMASVRDSHAGLVRIVSMPGPALFLLPELIAEFIKERPEIQVSLISKTSIEVQQLMVAQQFDIGVADVAMLPSPPSPLAAQEVFGFNCVCAMRSDDPLAAKPTLSAADLDGRPMAALFAEHTASRQTRAAFEMAKTHFNQHFEMQYFLPMFPLIEKGLTYAIVDPLSAESYRVGRLGGQKLVFRPFKPAIGFECAILTPLHRPRSATAAAMLQALRAEFTRIQNAYKANVQKGKVFARFDRHSSPV